MIIGKILICCKIPINTAKKMIGNNTVKKNGACPSFARPPNTKLTPASANFKIAPNPSAIPLLIQIRPLYSVRNMQVPIE